jgi:hypothetical protein
MRYPVHTQDTPGFLAGRWMTVLVIVAVSMFIGSWVIGPSLTHESAVASTAKEERMTYDAMMARPDPSPYRTATPQFDNSARPGYGAAAREKARAELGRPRTAAGNSVTDFPATVASDHREEQPRAHSSSVGPDRHTGVMY